MQTATVAVNKSSKGPLSAVDDSESRQTMRLGDLGDAAFQSSNVPTACNHACRN